MFQERPPHNRIVSPFQKNWAARVAIIEGTPTLATSIPLIKPTKAPAARARIRASQGVPRVRKMKENTKPENAIIAEKLKSISPAAITSVSPNAKMRSGGIVCRKDI